MQRQTEECGEDILLPNSQEQSMFLPNGNVQYQTGVLNEAKSNYLAPDLTNKALFIFVPFHFSVASKGAAHPPLPLPEDPMVSHDFRHFSMAFYCKREVLSPFALVVSLSTENPPVSNLWPHPCQCLTRRNMLVWLKT